MRARGPGQATLLLLDIAPVLVQEGIDYAVIGAMAAAAHGAIRATTDAGALLLVALSRLGPLANVFKEADFRSEPRLGDAEDPIPALPVLRDRHGNRVELLAELLRRVTRRFGRAATDVLEDILAS